MIKVNERFSLDTDKYNVILIERYEGKDKETKQPKIMSRETYHSSMLQACNRLIDKSAEGKTVEDIVDAINNAKRDIANIFDK